LNNKTPKNEKNFTLIFIMHFSPIDNIFLPEHLNKLEIVTKKVAILEQLPKEIWAMIGRLVYNHDSYIVLAKSLEVKMAMLKSSLQMGAAHEETQLMSMLFNCQEEFQKTNQLLRKVQNMYYHGLTRHMINWGEHMSKGDRATLNAGITTLISFTKAHPKLGFISLRCRETVYNHVVKHRT
jgi:hypothetical protein